MLERVPISDCDNVRQAGKQTLLIWSCRLPGHKYILSGAARDHWAGGLRKQRQRKRASRGNECVSTLERGLVQLDVACASQSLSSRVQPSLSTRSTASLNRLLVCALKTWCEVFKVRCRATRGLGDDDVELARGNTDESARFWICAGTANSRK